MDTWETVTKLIVEKKLRKGSFATAMGISRQTVDNWLKGDTSPDQKDIKKMSKILEVMPDELPDKSDKKRNEINKGKIPFYDTVAIGGMSLIPSPETVGKNNFEMIEPGAFLGKATGALRVYGDSMYGKYPSGCIIGFKEAHEWRDLIHYGHDYVIEFEDQRIVKNVQPSDKEGYILAVSYNSFVNKHGIDIYKPYLIPLKSIRKMHYVLGVLKFEASI
jgi:transcriptional regulator with XRE-family HTH domain